MCINNYMGWAYNIIIIGEGYGFGTHAYYTGLSNQFIIILPLTIVFYNVL